MMAAAGCEPRASDAQCAKEVSDKLAQLQAERAKQDKMWEKGEPTCASAANGQSANEKSK